MSGRELTVRFDRIGRDRAVAPLTITETTTPDDPTYADRLARQIHRYAFPRLLSTEVTVVVDSTAEPMQGFIAAGFHNAGRFTITPTADENPDE